MLGSKWLQVGDTDFDCCLFCLKSENPLAAAKCKQSAIQPISLYRFMIACSGLAILELTECKQLATVAGTNKIGRYS